MATRNPFDGQIAVVTGAAGGLGRALCQILAEGGAKVVALDRDREALEQLESGIQAEVCDITDNEACKAVAERVEARFGAPHILINNAGVTHFSPFRETTADTISKVMDVNFMGAVHVTGVFLEALIANKGSIVAISSVAGFSPLFGRSGYSASKHALHGFFDSLRSEVAADGVRVMIACPSFIATQADQREAAVGQGLARPGAASRTAGKPLSPEQVARIICQGIIDQRRLLIIGKLGKISYWLNKFAPTVFERLMVAKIRPEFGPR